MFHYPLDDHWEEEFDWDTEDDPYWFETLNWSDTLTDDGDEEYLWFE